MTGPRLALIADDQRLASAILAHVEKTLSLVLWQCSFEGIRRYPTAEADGLLLLASGSDADAEQVLRLVQEVYLQKLPVVLLVVEADTSALGKDLKRLDAFVAQRLQWPADAVLLSQFVRDRAVRIPHVAAVADESVEDVGRRRLLSQTPSLVPLVERIALAAAHDVTVLLTGETGTGKTLPGPADARLLAAQARPVPGGALRRPAGQPGRERLLRPRQGRLHRGRPAPRSASSRRPATAPSCSTRSTRWAWSSRPACCASSRRASSSRSAATRRSTAPPGSSWPATGTWKRRCSSGQFRQDLYYRLNVMSFHLPPLRERVQDIAPLVRGMAARFNTQVPQGPVRHQPGGAGRPGGVPLAGQHPPAGERACSRRCWSAAARSCCSSTCRSRSASTAGRPTGTAAVDGQPRFAAAQPRSRWSATSSSGPGQATATAGPRRRRPGHQPRDAVQEDEEIRPDARPLQPESRKIRAVTVRERSSDAPAC